MGFTSEATEAGGPLAARQPAPPTIIAATVIAATATAISRFTLSPAHRPARSYNNARTRPWDIGTRVGAPRLRIRWHGERRLGSPITSQIGRTARPHLRRPSRPRYPAAPIFNSAPNPRYSFELTSTTSRDRGHEPISAHVSTKLPKYA